MQLGVSTGPLKPFFKDLLPLSTLLIVFIFGQYTYFTVGTDYTAHACARASVSIKAKASEEECLSV